MNINETERGKNATGDGYELCEIIDRPALAAKIVGDRYNPRIYAIRRCDDNIGYRVETLSLDDVWSGYKDGTKARVSPIGDNQLQVDMDDESYIVSEDLLEPILKRICELWLSEAKAERLIRDCNYDDCDKTKREEVFLLRYYQSEDNAKDALYKFLQEDKASEREQSALSALVDSLHKFIKPPLISLVIALSLIFPTQSKALCSPSDFLGVTMIAKMCYECILPIHIFGVTILPSMPSRRDSVSPFYICSLIPPSFGFPVGFYEPTLSVEVVTDPMCFPTLGGGNSASGSQTGLFMAGSKANNTTAELTFYQTHIITTPILEMLGLLKSICPKAKATDFDILSLSELYPQWQDDALSAIIYPEALLFAAPPLQLACVADSVAANAYTPLDSLFWCKGSWGGAYPLSGTTQSKSLIEDTASVGANAIAFGHRSLLMWRTWGGDQALMCAGRVPHPLWDKSAYRMQLIGPVSHPIASQIGEAGIVKQWTAGKWRPNRGDNFTYLLFRKTDCLVGI